MKQCDVRFDLKVFAFIVAAFALLIATSSPLRAQVGAGVTPVPINAGRATSVALERAVAADNMRGRQWDMDHLENQPKTGYERAQQAVLYAQVKEDFVRLQVINNNVLHPVLVGKNLAAEDNKRLTEAVLEVKKRANRLKTNLRFPVSGNVKSTQPEIAEQEVKPSLTLLDKTILNFVNNPFFQKPDVLNLEQSTRAARDLNSIIKISDAIQKRLKASPQTAHNR